MDQATILSIRIPAFDAAIRKAAEPRLARRPVVVVSAFKPMGRVLAACPMAKREGIREEMHYQAARAHCPDAAFFLPDRLLGEETQAKILKEAGSYSPLVESVGNGRVLLDTRGTERLWGDGVAVAERLRRDLGGRLHLPVSAGLAARRPWSLLASRSAGEAGLRLVLPGEEEVFLQGIPVSWVEGVGPRTRARLMEMNIRTLGELRLFSREEIQSRFGPGPSKALWDALHPAAWDPIAPAGSSGAGRQDVVRAEAALAVPAAPGGSLQLVAKTLAARIAESLRARDAGAARLSLTLIYADGAARTAKAATGGYIQDEDLLAAATGRLLDTVCDRRVRVSRLWLTADKLAAPERQGRLFDPSPEEGGIGKALPHRQQARIAADAIRKRFGEGSLQPAAILAARGLASRAG